MHALSSIQCTNCNFPTPQKKDIVTPWCEGITAPIFVSAVLLQFHFNPRWKSEIVSPPGNCHNHSVVYTNRWMVKTTWARRWCSQRIAARLSLRWGNSTMCGSDDKIHFCPQLSPFPSNTNNNNNEL